MSVDDQGLLNGQKESMPSVSVLRGPSHPLPRDVTNLSRLLEVKAASTPAATAIIYTAPDGRVHKLTYRELDRAANRLARALMARVGMGATPEVVVVVNLSPSHALPLTLLAVWKAGAAYLPLDQTPPARKRHILGEARPVLVITEEPQDQWDETLRAHNTVSYTTLDAEATEMSDAALSVAETLPPAPQPLAVVHYTSGSTGVPKGVLLTHAVVLNRICWEWREFPFGPTERVNVFKTTVTFVDAVWEIWGPLLHPSPIALLVVPRNVTKDPQRLIPLLEEFKVERLLMVPTQLRAILLYLDLDPSHTPPSLKTWVCSSEPLTKSLAQKFLDQFRGRDVLLCNFYGSTEVMGDVLFHRIRSAADLAFDSVPIGRPLDNTTVYLLDGALRPVLAGDIGEVYVAGLNVCPGYVNGRDPHKFIPNPHSVDPDMGRLYHTGDYGRLVKGTFLYGGRSDSQVKVRGHRVDLSEVETALTSLPQVGNVVVLCYQPGEIDQMLIAYVTLQPGVMVTADELEEALHTHLPAYALPQVLITDVIPLHNNGKVDRQALLKRYAELSGRTAAGAEVDADYSGVVEGQRPAARCLLRTVASVLGGAVRGAVSLNANFYQLGGNSLNTVYTVTKLRDQGYVMGISEFISATTLMSVVDKMVPESKIKDTYLNTNSTQQPYTCELLSLKNKHEVYKIIADSFYMKGDLEQCFVPRIPKQAYHQLLDQIWDPLLKAELSFVLCSRQTGAVASVLLAYDAHDAPDFSLSGDINYIFQFLEFLEAPIRQTKLPQGRGKVVYSFLMGTEQGLSAADNVAVMHDMEHELLTIARRRRYAGIFTTNTNPLTKQLGADVFDYKVLCDYQVNRYVAKDGSRPFSVADDTFRVYCCWKEI